MISAIGKDSDPLPRTGKFGSLVDIFVAVADVFHRPDRFTVTEIAEKHVVIKRLGARTGKWSAEFTPYMVEPQNLLSSRELSAIIFCASSQSGKTEGLILNWIAYSVIQDAADMIVFNPTQQNSRDFSVRRVDRLNFNSPEIKARLMKNRSGDNKQQKIYSSGMILSLSWPTISEMAGKPVGRIALTDYDRIDDDIGGEGSAFDLAFMRTTTYGSFAMTIAESSPSHPVTDIRWISESPHQAPPAGGILALYNRGDRRRWYWPCPSCIGYFEGNFKHLKWEDKLNALDSADSVRMICPICGYAIRPDERGWMQENGVWLKDGQGIDADGRIIGKGPRSKIASFWLNGVAAGFQTWQEIVAKFIDASREYDRTASEGALAQFFNNVLGEPYHPKSEELERLPEILQARAEPLPELQVAEGIRFLVACVDVQRNAFVVQVHGIGPGVPYDITIVDRFTIFKSNRHDADGDRLWVKPGSQQEDWDLLVDEVMAKTYTVSDSKVMTIKMTVCDSGGEDGVTTNAYDFYRSVRSKGLANRFHLVKGNARVSAPRVYIDFPDSKRKDRLAAARGDVPVMFLNSNVWKDTLSNRLDSITPGKGMIRFPDWLPAWFYKELCAERRTDKGWEATRGTRNEAWDLLYYCLGVCASQLLRIEHIDWTSPPSWADDWSKNPLVVDRTTPNEVLRSPAKPAFDFAELGKALA
jgi:phage terminase large subunit GpA-like protein